MVGSVASQSQLLHPSAEEEVLKRNTDCVYFLASPLTCKKGSECEYRHSDIARVNPRDCWFWLNGNCLNPKCGFRHPPLDGLLEPQMPISSGSGEPMSQRVMKPSSAPVVNATSKPSVPCIFFQNGFCLKGDWCPFLHAANSTKNKASVVPVTASAIEHSTFNKVEMHVQENKVPLINKGKAIKVSSNPLVEGGVGRASLRNELSINNRISDTSCINELPDPNGPPVSDGNMASWSSHVHRPHLLDEPGMIDNKDSGEVSREPSPGFDVLVDDEGKDSDFYHGEDQYGMSKEYEQYDIDHLTDYNMTAEIVDDRYKDQHGHDSHGYCKDHYGPEQNRASSDRMSAGSSYLKRRPYPGADSCGQVDELDLRHRLARNKQPNGLRSVISHGHAHDKHVQDRISPHESSLSSRLQGRIKLPGRSLSPVERSMARGTDHGRLYPARVRPSSNQGRILGRIKGRVEETSRNGSKNDKGLQLTRDAIGDNNTDFSGPKSLAELKNKKNTEPSGQQVMDQQQFGKRKYSVIDGRQPNENDLSFKGPKSLEEILKKKRAETIGTVSNRHSCTSGDIIEDTNQKEGKVAPNNTSVSSTEQKVEFDSEQDGGEEFDLYEGDNGGGEGEYIDDDDDDEFAKKMGVMYS